MNCVLQLLVCLQSERKTYSLQFPARKLSGKVCPKLPRGITEKSCLISQSHSIIVGKDLQRSVSIFAAQGRTNFIYVIPVKLVLEDAQC